MSALQFPVRGHTYPRYARTEGEAEDSAHAAAEVAVDLIRQDDAVTGLAVAVCGYTDEDHDVGFSGWVVARYTRPEERRAIYISVINHLIAQEDVGKIFVTSLGYAGQERALWWRVRMCWHILTRKAYGG